MEIDLEKINIMQEYLKSVETPGIDRAYETMISDTFLSPEKT